MLLNLIHELNPYSYNFIWHFKLEIFYKRLIYVPKILEQDDIKYLVKTIFNVTKPH